MSEKKETLTSSQLKDEIIEMTNNFVKDIAEQFSLADVSGFSIDIKYERNKIPRAKIHVHSFKTQSENFDIEDGNAECIENRTL